jgi:hypothetical protein
LKNLTDMGFPKRRAAQALAMTRFESSWTLVTVL